MTTKNYLSQIDRWDKMIQNKLSEICRLRAMATSTSSYNDSERVQTPIKVDKLSDIVTTIVNLENETNQLANDLVKKRKYIIQQIDSIKDVDYYNILAMRYINGATFEEIANNTHWSIRKVFSMHGKALEEFEKMYGIEYL